MPDLVATTSNSGSAHNLTKTTIWQNRKAIVICCVVASASFEYGFDFGLIGGFQAMPGFLMVFGHRDPQLPLGWGISSKVQQLIGSLMTLGAFLSSLTAGPLAKLLNRRASIALAILLCSVSLAIMIGTTSLGALYFARLLIGLANGLFMTFVQLYIQECSPPHLRGFMFAGFQFWVSFGSFAGTIVDNYTAKIMGKGAYQIPLAVLFVIPAMLAFLLPFIPESPRWLVQNGKEDKALRHLKRLRGSDYPDVLVLEEFEEMKAAYAAEVALSATSSWMDLFKDPINRRRTLLSMGAVSLQGGSGAMFLLVYGVYFFEIAGSHDPFANGIIISCLGLASILVMFWIVKVLPRRTILLTAIAVQSVTMLIAAIIYTVAPTHPAALKCLIAFLSIYLFWYGGWLGPIAWVCGGEIPSQRLRSMTLGLSSGMGFFLGWVASFTAPYFINVEDLNWGPKYGYIWAGSNAICFVWVWLYLPETKDRTLEEIDEMFNHKIAARKFASYKCVASQRAREQAVVKLEDEKKDEGTVQHLERVGRDSNTPSDEKEEA